MSHLVRGVVIYEKGDGLARDVCYSNIVEYLWVVEWNFSGDCEKRTRMQVQSKKKYRHEKNDFA